MNILQISDLHKLVDYEGKGGRYAGIVNAMSDPFIQLSQVLEEVNEDLDLVIFSGDICEYGGAGDYLTVRKKLEETFDCPVLVCSGNHDNKDELIKAFGKKKTDGELFEDQMIGDLRVIMIDSSDERYNDGYISEKTCDLLEEALKTKTAHPILLVTHHHLLEGQFAMPVAQYPERFRDIIASSDIIAVLTGHTHHIFHGHFAGKPYHTCGSLSFVGEEKDGGLRFYEQPSCIVYTLQDRDLSWRDIVIGTGSKTLEVWKQ